MFEGKHIFGNRKKSAGKVMNYDKSNMTIIIDDPDDDPDFCEEDFMNEESFAENPFFHVMSMSHEERDALINTGFFNSYIEGYLLLAMKEYGFSRKEIEKTVELLQNKILEDYTAKMARDASKNPEDVLLDAGCIQLPPQDNVYHIPRAKKPITK